MCLVGLTPPYETHCFLLEPLTIRVWTCSEPGAQDPREAAFMEVWREQVVARLGLALTRHTSANNTQEKH